MLKRTISVAAVSLLTLCATSCGVMNLTGSDKAKADALKIGMTTEQVNELMGEPDFKRATPSLEQWEYRRAYYYDNEPVTLIVGFEEGRVVTLNSDTAAKPETPVIAVCPPSPQSPHHDYWDDGRFDRFLAALKALDFPDERMRQLKEEAPYLRLTCGQCVRLMKLFDFWDTRIQCLKVVAPHLVDYHNGDLIEAQFADAFESDRRKVHKIIVDASRASNYVQMMDDAAFDRFLAAFRNRSFDSERIEMLKDKQHTAFFNSRQCAQILGEYDFDSEKLEVLKLLAPMIGNFRDDDLIVDSFEFSSSKQQARTLLNKYRPAYAH